jgi:hypothetical protein
MTTALVAALALALAATVLKLSREMRLRKALEKLLRILLTRWRAHAKSQLRDADRMDPDSPGDDQRL